MAAPHAPMDPPCPALRPAWHDAAVRPHEPPVEASVAAIAGVRGGD